MSKILILLSLFFLVFSQEKRVIINPLDVVITDVTADTSKISEIQVTTRLPYDLFTFEKNGAVFFSSYETGIFVENAQGEVVFNDLEKAKVELKHYNHTNSRQKFNQKTYKIKLGAGSYVIKTFIYDMLSKTNYSKSKSFDVDAPFSSNRMLSKLRLFNLTDENRKSMRGNRFFDNDGNIEIEFYSYNPNQLKDLTAYIAISYGSENVFFSKTIDNILYDKNNRAILFAVVPKSIFIQRRSTVHVSLFRDGQLLDELFTPVFFAWKIIPRTVDDMRDALTYMKYILPEDTLDHYLEQPLDISQAFFKQYWINSSVNKTEKDGLAMQQEYFQRVRYTNQHFGRSYKNLPFKDSGWSTDRGRIYIKYGPPDRFGKVRVETLGDFKNYVIEWQYQRYRKKFVFYYSKRYKDYNLDSKSEAEEHSL